MASPGAVHPGTVHPGTVHPGTGDDADRVLLGSSREHPEQFAEIYRRHFAAVYRYVAGRLGPDAADDLAAETFLAAFRRRGAFDPDRGLVRAWLFGIATNLVAQHGRAETRRYRALARSGAGPAADAEDEDRIADRLTAAGLRGPLAAALAGLATADRDVLLLAALGGLSYGEIAAALSIPPGTVGSRLNRARLTLRAALAGVYPAADHLPPRLAARARSGGER